MQLILETSDDDCKLAVWQLAKQAYYSGYYLLSKERST